MDYSVCVSSVYMGRPFEEGVRRAAALGYRSFEFWGCPPEILEAANRARRETGLKVKAFCANMVPLTQPERHGEYMERLREDIKSARRLEAELLLAQVGPELPDVPRAAQHEAIVQGLKACAPLLEDAGVVLAVEPLNALVDHKGYYLTRSGEGFDIVREVDSPAVRLVFDVYHQQISEGNILSNLLPNLDLVCHVHIAGNPGRHEPLIDSEVHYPTIINALRRAGYRHDVGLEYIPAGDADESLRRILQEMPVG